MTCDRQVQRLFYPAELKWLHNEAGIGHFLAAHDEERPTGEAFLSPLLPPQRILDH